MQASRARTVELRRSAAFDRDDIDTGQSELGGRHHPRWTGADDDDLMLGGLGWVRGVGHGATVGEPPVAAT